MIDQPKRRPLNKPQFEIGTESMSKSEKVRFEYLRKNGIISFFDCRGCEVCGEEIPLVKRYCSKACEEKAKKGGRDA